MKRIKHLFTALLLLCTTVATAHDFEVDGIYYYITNSTKKTVAVTYKGGSYSEYSNEYTGNVVIPESVAYNGSTYSVTSIGNDAFYSCYKLTSIVIPNGVTSIGDYAFYNCFGLTSFVIGNSVTSIGRYAFYNCYGLTSAVIGNSVTSIGSAAFYDCSGLTSVVIGNSVTSIGNNAFENCDGLKTVINLSSLTVTKASSSNGYVGYYANNIIDASNGSIEGDFGFCIIDGVNTLVAYFGNETEIVLPENYKGANYAIGADVFRGKKSITSIVIPNSVTSIGDEAFEYCSGLTAVHISDLSAWCNIDFGYLYSNPLYYAKNLYLNGESVTELVIPDDVTKIKNDAFYGCSGLTSVVIPNSVTSIGSVAFYGCSGLKTVINFSNLTFTKGSTDNGYVAYYAENIVNGSIIDDFVFYVTDGVNTLVQYLGNDTEIVLPENYNGETYTIGDNVFKDNTTITSIAIPNSVTSIEESAFYGCSGLTAVHINDLSAWCNIDFVNDDSNPLYYAKNLYLNGESVTELVIPDDVTKIKNDAFYGCSGLTSVVIPNSVTSIGQRAFINCTSLTAVHISDLSAWCNIDFVDYDSNPLSYAKNLYLNGESVTELVIPNDVTKIKSYAFYNCSSLTSIEIPNSVTTIGEHAFEGCTALTAVTFDAESVKDFFKDNTVITDITFTNRVKAIESKSFVGMSKLTNIMLETTIPPVLSNDAFTKLQYKLIYMYVPEGFIKAYKAADVWKNFWDIQEIEYTGPTYKLTFMLDGEIYATYALAPGAEMPSLEEPAKEGYTFSGWNLDEYISELGYPVMPAEDITVEGTFVEDATTGINQVMIDRGEVVIYDLNGLRIIDVHELKRGVYIINGKKVVK